MKTSKYLIIIGLCVSASVLLARPRQDSYPIDSVAKGRLLQHITENQILVRCSDQELLISGYYYDSRLQKREPLGGSKTVKGYISGDVILELPIGHEALLLPDDPPGKASIKIFNLKQDGVITTAYNKLSTNGETDVVRNTFRKFILADQPATPTKIELAQKQLEELNTQVKALAEAVTVVQSKPKEEISITDTLSTITTQLKAISEQLEKLQKEINDKPS